MIYILTGAIRSGKTTTLFNWCKNRQDVDGLLCPDNSVGKRFFLKTPSEVEVALEVGTDVETEKIIQIGNFRFLKSAFDKANNYLLTIASNNPNNYIIIDEIGKLELKNDGLHESAEQLISKFQLDEKHHVILVVRDYLLDAVLEHYAISEYSVIKNEDLKRDYF
ncbi:nucleoside-triphosphatase [Bizionia sp.]|uniref:nucleoside-triphosphatase n=1 Tax=Bizionia sp. TaxID=1954480 RepID=UPI003A956263